MSSWPASAVLDDSSPAPASSHQFLVLCHLHGVVKYARRRDLLLEDRVERNRIGVRVDANRASTRATAGADPADET